MMEALKKHDCNQRMNRGKSGLASRAFLTCDNKLGRFSQRGQSCLQLPRGMALGTVRSAPDLTRGVAHPLCCTEPRG